MTIMNPLCFCCKGCGKTISDTFNEERSFRTDHANIEVRCPGCDGLIRLNVSRIIEVLSTEYLESCYECNIDYKDNVGKFFDNEFDVRSWLCERCITKDTYKNANFCDT